MKSVHHRPRNIRRLARRTLGTVLLAWVLMNPVPSLTAEETKWISGFTKPHRDAVLTAPVAGIIDDIHFQLGDTVEAGDVVVELDRRLEEIEVRRRKIFIEDLTKVLERTRELFGRTKSVSQEELDQKAAELEIARAELELATEQLERRRIRAPFSGVVADLFDLEPGEGCQVQTPIVRIIDTSRCWLEIYSPPRLLNGVEAGKELAIVLEEDQSQREVAGRVSFVSPVIDPASGLLRVRVEFDNQEAKIRPGALGRVELPAVE